jgi:hypothetical protein
MMAFSSRLHIYVKLVKANTIKSFKISIKNLTIIIGNSMGISCRTMSPATAKPLIKFGCVPLQSEHPPNLYRICLELSAAMQRFGTCLVIRMYVPSFDLDSFEYTNTCFHYL